MASYFAKKENTGTYLSESRQIDVMLAKGFDIYRKNDDGSEELVATPDGGYLYERPIIEQY